MTDLAVGEWQEAAIQVAQDIGTGVLAFEECSPVDRVGNIGQDRQGAYVPILSGDCSLHVGVVSDESGCASLTRALLGMAPDEAVSIDDIHDAVGEIANMVAGGIKTKVTAKGTDAQIGLPIFIQGHIESGSATQSVVSQLKFGDVEVCITVVKTSKSPNRGSIRT